MPASMQKNCTADSPDSDLDRIWTRIALSLCCFLYLILRQCVTMCCCFCAAQVRCTASQRGELRDLVQIFRLGVIDVSHTTMTLEVQGREDKMAAITDLLEPYGA